MAGYLGCRIGRTHEYDATSGWCIHGCGCRDDGRMVKADRGDVGEQFPTFTHDEINDLLGRHDNDHQQPITPGSHALRRMAERGRHHTRR